MKIVLDTNVIFGNWYLDSPNFKVVEQLVKLGVCKLVIPEIVMLEVRNKYKEELNSFYNSKPDLNFFSNKGVLVNDGFGVNKQVSGSVCTPCTPEGISGSVGGLKQAPDTSTNRYFLTKSACELPDGDPLIGKCSGCGKSGQEIVAINREFRVGYCECCYEKLDD